MVAQDIGSTVDFAKACRIGDYGQLSEIRCGANRQAKARVICETSGLDKAVEYYEAVSPGKGLELALQIRSAILQVCEFAGSAPVTRGSVRSIVVQPDSRWDYTVHYRVKPTHVRVLAVAHQARQPFYWLGRR